MANYKIIGGDRKEYGPVTQEQLRRWITEGRLNGQSLAQIDGSAEWKPLAAFGEFAEALRAQFTGLALPSTTGVATPNVELWTVHILSRHPEVQVGRCLALSWKLFRANFGLLFAATFLVWLISFICQLIPFGYWIFRGVLYGGLYLIFLNRIRGRPAAVGDVFAGFSLTFLQLMLASFVGFLLIWIGSIFCFVPGLYLLVAWTFAVPLVADKRLEFWTAMEVSRKVVTRVWFEVFGLILLAFLPVILVYAFAEIKIFVTMFSAIQDLTAAGRPDFRRMIDVVINILKTSIPLAMLIKLVLLFNLPFALGALMYAYENLFGTRTASAA